MATKFISKVPGMLQLKRVGSGSIKVEFERKESPVFDKHNEPTGASSVFGECSVSAKFCKAHGISEKEIANLILANKKALGGISVAPEPKEEQLKKEESGK